MEALKLKSSTKMSPSEFFSSLFQIRNQIHIRHLRITGTGSYAGHKALNEFYDGILDLTDSLIESYQGKYGIVNLTVKESKDADAIRVLEDLARLTDNGEVYKMFKESWLQNQLDEISQLTYQTLYKLKNLS